MPLTSNLSCGIDVGFTEDLKKSLSNCRENGCDFICTNITKEGCKPFEIASLKEKFGGITEPEYLFNSQGWAPQVVAKITHSDDLTSTVAKKRLVAEETMKQELRFATFLGMKAIMIEVKGEDCSNAARILCSYLQQSSQSLNIWVRIPMHSEDSKEDTWKWWDSFRTMCNYDKRIGVALKLSTHMPPQSSRWLGEPIKVLDIPLMIFLKEEKGVSSLPHSYRQFVQETFLRGSQVILSGEKLENKNEKLSERYYLDQVHKDSKYIGQYERFGYTYMGASAVEEHIQCLANDIDSSIYEIFEQDTTKYENYKEAVRRCLLDTVSDAEAHNRTVVIMVLGAGRGPLVRMSLQAAKETNRKVRIYAVDKNKNAIILLEHLKSTEWKNEDVSIVSADMRDWVAPELADIVVSELLGCFGDNELSPECLDGTNRFLKSNAICIPQSYTSFIAPMTGHDTYNGMKEYAESHPYKPQYAAFETLCEIRALNYHELTDPKPLFTFNHPNWDLNSENPEPDFFPDTTLKIWDEKFSPKPKDAKTKADYKCGGVTMPNNIHNSRYKRVAFTVPVDTTIQGFIGYFRCSLYKDIELSIEPKSHSEGMFGWCPVYLPLQNPLPISEGEILEADFWRCTSDTKVWFEWCLVSPQPSKIHNTGGRSESLGM